MPDDIKEYYDSDQFFTETIGRLIALLRIHELVYVEPEMMQILEEASIKRGKLLGNYLTGLTGKVIYISSDSYIKIINEHDMIHLDPESQLILRNILDKLN